MRALPLPVLVLLLAACGQGGPDLPSAKDFPPIGSPPAIKVLSAGSTGRALRFTPKTDASDRLRTDVKLTSSVSGGGQSMDIDLGMELTSTNRVVEVKPDGSVSMRSEVDGAKVTIGGKLAEMGISGDQMADMVKGIATIVEVDGRGRLLNLSFDGNNAVMDQMQMGIDKGLSSGFVPFPEEAIGPGAEWDSLGHMDAMGVKAQLVGRYKLLELNGSVAKLQLTMRGKAEPQRAQLPNAPVEVDLEKLEITGGGTLEIDLERPTRGKADITVKVSASMTAEGQSVDTGLSMHMVAAPIP